MNTTTIALYERTNDEINRLMDMNTSCVSYVVVLSLCRQQDHMKTPLVIHNDLDVRVVLPSSFMLTVDCLITAVVG
jgi:hypothetical protein